MADMASLVHFLVIWAVAGIVLVENERERGLNRRFSEACRLRNDVYRLNGAECHETRGNLREVETYS